MVFVYQNHLLAFRNVDGRWCQTSPLGGSGSPRLNGDGTQQELGLTVCSFEGGSVCVCVCVCVCD